MRKKWIVLTPEEWVRQHWVWHLIQNKNFPPGLIAIEKKVTINGMTKRFDVLAGHPAKILIECKAPTVPINQLVADQALRYNLILKVPFLILSNGLDHLLIKVNHETKSIETLSELPNYEQL